ncbi:uncharacterized protein AB675_8876 [Cyphellophora attinorum]|uniref:Uncharacterized protein n=1 Tax=Cyphellophora attinorum TaxID=1664694 RepID=A0A0N1H5D5_9EURO|nr:uncharacterized protein AB675_8876 [Phialophora attinorum]KPI36190.1 hypothetical protein AB675_8876 [Phialophora attinorum]
MDFPRTILHYLREDVPFPAPSGREHSFRTKFETAYQLVGSENLVDLSEAKRICRRLLKRRGLPLLYLIGCNQLISYWSPFHDTTAIRHAEKTLELCRDMHSLIENMEDKPEQEKLRYRTLLAMAEENLEYVREGPADIDDIMAPSSEEEEQLSRVI